MLLLPLRLFEKYPALGKAAHWLSATASFLLIAPNEELAQLTAFLPGNLTAHRYFGWGLALLTFTRFLAKKTKASEAAAPAVPASEEITKRAKRS